MILILFLQLTIDSAIEAYHNTDYEQAYNIAFSIPVDSTSFHRDEVLELRAYTSMKVREFEQADSLFQIVLKSEFESIRFKALMNYAELQHLQFHFGRRIHYLKKAYEIKHTNQLTRIIARHYFQIEADYEQAESWLSKHTTPETDKDSSGYFSTLAQLAESKRQYQQAIDYYSMAKKTAQQANLFSYELFASEGLYRSEKLSKEQTEEKVINSISLIILSLLILWYANRKRNSDVKLEDTGSFFNN